MLRRAGTCDLSHACDRHAGLNCRSTALMAGLMRIVAAPAPYNPIKPSCRPSLPATGARNVDTCAVKTLKKRRLPLNTTRSPLNGFNGTPEVLPAAQEAPNTPDTSPWWMQLGPTWSLCVLTLAYLHHSTTGYALPALLPIISEDLHLVDTQAATLTAGYTVLYALAMLPLGIAADRVQSRPRLLAWGIAAWSLLTLGAARTHSFAELLAARVGFAGAQATQNPVCFALIPDLFPKNRTRAMALYNAAIYAGRALSFGVLMLAVKLGVPKDLINDTSYVLVPLDKVDLSLVSIMFIQGDYAAVSPVFNYAATLTGEVPIESAFSAWRQLMTWVGAPGLLLAGLCWLTVREPAGARRGGKGPGGGGGGGAGAGGAAAPAPPTLAPRAGAHAAHSPPPAHAGWVEALHDMRSLLSNRGFLALTGAAAVNDVGSWALVAWQGPFYQRVYDVGPEVYAPLLAVVIPVGGLLGGVGTGLAGDWLQRRGLGSLLTVGSNLAAAPVLAASMLMPDHRSSMAVLLLGFALSEAWRAPAAVALRDVSPPGRGAAASALHLCLRNLVGGVGPLAVAALAGRVGLQHAMLLVPGCFFTSGLGFWAVSRLNKAQAGR
ncbi:hypothetical protein ACKKBG_A19555 [Auxenochlorella protothecoides x Auxenochlorella symbiontica]